MKALVVYCHPNPASFTAAVLEVVLEELTKAGAEVRLTDLYSENFQPVLQPEELDGYLETRSNRLPVNEHADNLEWCDTLIFVYPTWWYGLPALLKGWLDRTMLPGLAFHMPEEGERAIRPGLRHIRRFGAFTTCGASWVWTKFVGAPGKMTLLRGLRPLCRRWTRTAFAAHYRMDTSTAGSRASHLAKVRRRMKRLVA